MSCSSIKKLWSFTNGSWAGRKEQANKSKKKVGNMQEGKIRMIGKGIIKIRIMGWKNLTSNNNNRQRKKNNKISKNNSNSSK